MDSGVPIVNHLPDFEGRERLYDTLDEDSRQIRLVVLQGSNDRESPLKILLHTVDLETAQDTYMALSYYWGDPKATETVLVKRSSGTDTDECFDVPVTRNLASALREMRNATSQGLLLVWTDAICINQTNIVERNYQVKIMYDIFSASRWVWGWLGDLTPELDESLSWLVGLYTWKESPADMYDEDNLRRCTDIEPIDIKSHAMGGTASLKLLEALAATSPLWNSPYWRRGWVIQEVSAGSEVAFVCGNRILPGAAIWNLRKLFRARQTALLDLTPENIDHLANNIAYDTLAAFVLAHSATLNKDKGISQTRISHDYWSFIGRFETTDPRDFVYAHMNTWPFLQNLEPNYGHSVMRVFMDATMTLLHAATKWHYLKPASDSTSVSVPSWAINFASVPQSNALDTSLYDAAASSVLRARLGGPDTLITSAFITDRIQHIAGIDHQSNQNDPSPLASKMTLFLEAKKFFDRVDEQHETSHDPSRSEFLRLICADSVSPGEVSRRCTQVDLHLLRIILWKHGLVPAPTLNAAEIRMTGLREENLGQSLWLWTSILLHRFDCGMTKEGRYAFVPKDAEKGDLVAIFAGGSVPLILRPAGTRSGSTVYRIIGMAYIDGKSRYQKSEPVATMLIAAGIMDGEAVKIQAGCNMEDELSAEQVEEVFQSEITLI